MNDIVQIDRRVFGAAIGDIIGSSYERKRDRIKTTKFDLFTERSQFTDDTVLTAAIALWLMESPEHDEALLRKNLLEMGLRYYDPASFTFGPGFSSWLLQEAGSVILGRPHVQGQSMGNGSAMRVGPVGLYANSLQEAVTLATTTACITHNQPEGIRGAQAIAGCVYLAKTGHGKSSIKDYMADLGYDMNRTIEEIRPTYKFQSNCENSVSEAVIAYLEGDTFEDVIRLVVSLGGDADTQGAMACSIAAATPGMEIPDAIFQKSIGYLDDHIKHIMERFSLYINNYL